MLLRFPRTSRLILVGKAQMLAGGFSALFHIGYGGSSDLPTVFAMDIEVRLAYRPITQMRLSDGICMS